MNKDYQSADANREPNPLEVWGIILAWIADPQHANAITALATVAICLTGIFYTVYSRLQWQAAEKAADAAERAAEVSAAIQRPWLRLSMELSSLRYFPDTERYQLTVIPTVNNVGAGVAQEVSLWIEPRIPPINFGPYSPTNNSPQNSTTVAWEVWDWCRKKEPFIRGTEIYFPADKRPSLPVSTSFRSDDAIKGSYSANGEQFFSIQVYGCLIYRFSSLSDWHRTAIVYELADEHGKPITIALRRELSPMKLSIVRFAFAPEHAD
jgi:hypothetical protein